MERGLLEHARSERLVATGRLVLAVFALAVAYLDPEIGIAPNRLLWIAAGFATYAVVLAGVAWRARIVTFAGRVVVHSIDFLIFSAFIEVTTASVSPFFTFFLFSLLSGLLRFGVRGMVITALVAIATYVLMSLTDERIRSDPAYLIVRVTSLSVATLLLAHAGAYQERVRLELAQIAAWPAAPSGDATLVLRQTLRLASELMSSPRTTLVWEDEEPWTAVATLDEENLTITREAPDLLARLVTKDVGGATFAERRGEGVLLALDGRASRSDTSALTAEGVSRFDPESMLSACIRGDMVSGRVFFFDRTADKVEDLAVADVVARLIAARLDQLTMAERGREAAVAQERLRVARDLHDGFLQSLTAVSLQLELIDRYIEADGAAAREKLRSVQDVIASDQKELRMLISNLRPQAPPPRPKLGERLQDLAVRLKRQWNVEVEIVAEPASPELPHQLTSEIYNLISEGVVNAARHARASRVAVELYTGLAEIAIIVADDGKGFDFAGVYTLEELNLHGRGPRTLKERVAALGGELVLHSSPAGSRIEIRLDRPGSA